MKTVFHNANGLTAFALACGYVQMVHGPDREMVDLFMEHGCYHVRAYNADGERLEWVSEGRLSDARRHWKKLVNLVFGARIEQVKRCKRYEVRHVLDDKGEAVYQVIYRHDGESRHVGYCDNKDAAWMLAYRDYVSLYWVLN